MKIILYLLLSFMIASCNEQTTDTSKLQATIDSLQQKLDDTYKPGFGEFMSGIQMHHAKLWFAGQNQNWALADFEINEIKESLEDIRKYNTDRPEVKSIGMIDPALDSVSMAIEKKDPVSFKNHFITLTNTCNACHKTTEHAFNVVIIPSALPVVNQDFKPQAQ